MGMTGRSREGRERGKQRDHRKGRHHGKHDRLELHRVRREEALDRNARDVYEYDRDFPGEFSDE